MKDLPGRVGPPAAEAFQMLQVAQCTDLLRARIPGSDSRGRRRRSAIAALAEYHARLPAFPSVARIGPEEDVTIKLGIGVLQDDPPGAPDRIRQVV